MTSPLGSLVNAVLAQVGAGSEFGAVVDDGRRRDLLRGLFQSYYAREMDKEVVFDTNRLWCARLPVLLDLFPDARIIACVRDVAWIMDSLERMHRASPYENTLLFGGNAASSHVYNRLEGLAQANQLVGFAWSALREAFYGPSADRILVVDYDLLAQAPGKVLPLIYRFIGEPVFDHDFDSVEYDAREFDLRLGAPGLHKVRRKVEFTPRRAIIPPDLFAKYTAMTFWGDTGGSAANVIAPKSDAQTKQR